MSGLPRPVADVKSRWDAADLVAKVWQESHVINGTTGELPAPPYIRDCLLRVYRYLVGTAAQ
jgi:hypothetical protein